MLPEPAARVRFLVLSASPSRVLSKMIAPPAVVKVEPADVFRITGAVNSNGLFAVVRLAPR